MLLEVRIVVILSEVEAVSEREREGLWGCWQYSAS